jgi:DnaJ-class molecular chaperone
MTELDPYVLLGVRAGASKQEIDDAFEALAALYHPDINPDDAAAERSRKEISAAFALLNDPVARAPRSRGGPSDRRHRGYPRLGAEQR